VRNLHSSSKRLNRADGGWGLDEQRGAPPRSQNVMMATNLLQRCIQASSGGADFPTVWHTVLRGHSLVAGIPAQRLQGTRVLLEIPLITRQSLIYDGEMRRFSLE